MTEEQDPVASGTSKELERLRDILYGEQARATEDRLGALEIRLEQVRKELNSLFRKENKGLQTTFEEQLTSLSKELKNHQAEAEDQLESVRSSLTTDLNDRHNEQSKQLRELRQQLVEISAALEDSKVSRSELGAILIEMGERILGESSD